MADAKYLWKNSCWDILGDLVTGKFFWYGLPHLLLTCRKWKTKTITHQLASIKWDALTPPTRIAETWSLAIKSQKTTVFYKITWLDGSKTRKKTFSGEPWPPPFSRGKRIIDSNPTLSTEKIWHIEAFTRSKLLHREACTRRTFYTELGKLLFTASFYTKQAFVHSKLLPDFFYTRKLLHRSLYTEKLLHTAGFDTKKFLHRKAFTHTVFLQRSIYTAFTHREAFTQRSPFTEKHLHREGFTHRSFYKHQTFTNRNFYTEKLCTQKLLHTANFSREAFNYTQQTFTEKLLNRQAFAHRSFYTASFHTEKAIHREAFITQRSFYTQQTFTYSQLLHRKAFAHRKLSHREALQSNDKLMPNSCLGQILLVNHHGIAVSRNSCLSHAQISWC